MIYSLENYPLFMLHLKWLGFSYYYDDKFMNKVWADSIPKYYMNKDSIKIHKEFKDTLGIFKFSKLPK